jgi:crossover junction endodeoxyribonuclease RuvC
MTSSSDLSFVVGIDASLTATGICQIASNGEHRISIVKTIKEGKNLSDRIARYDRGVDAILQYCSSGYSGFGHGPLLIFIEGYAHSARGSATLSLAEYGILVRKALSSRNPQGIVQEISPTVVKKFATGKGNTSKVQVASSLASRYRISFESDDAADAFALAKLASMVIGFEKDANAVQRKIVADLKESMEIVRAERGNG